MSMMGELATLRRDLINAIDQRIGMLFGWTLTATSSAMGDADQVQGDDENQVQRPVRRLEQWGVRGRPPSKVRSFWIRIGASNIIFLGIAPTKSYGPSDIGEGETSLYCAAGGTRVYLDKDGNIKIDAASGKDVIVNGGSAKVARVGDLVASHTHSFGTLKDGMGVACTGATGAAAPAIDEGANNFKA